MTMTPVSVEILVQRSVDGRYNIPDFQRGFVWPPQKVKDLIDSLWRNYPIGSILLWDNQDYAQPRAAQSGTTQKWVIDGHQRLTALCLMTGSKPYWWRGVRSWNEHYRKCDVIAHIDPTEDGSDIAFTLPSTRGIELPWVSVRDVISRSDTQCTKLARSIVDIIDDDNGDELFGSTYSLLQSLRGINSRIVNVNEVTHGMEDVAEIFTRLNMKGTKVKETDVAIAWISSVNPGWNSRQFLPFLRGLERKGFDLSPAVVVRTLSGIARSTTKLADVPRDFWSTRAFSKAWKRTKEGLSFSIRLLSEYGILSSDLLPSHNALIPLVSLVNKFSGTEFDKDNAIYWLFMASRAQRYSGAAMTALNQDLGEIKGAQSFDEAFQKLLNRLESGWFRILKEELKDRFRQSDLMMLYFMLIFNNEAKDWVHRTRIGWDKSKNMADEGFSPEWHHFFPKTVLRRHGYDEDLMNAFSNITVLTEKQRAFRTSPKEYVAKYRIPKRYLKQQFIPSDESFLSPRKYKGFLDERTTMLAREMNEFLRKLRG